MISVRSASKAYLYAAVNLAVYLLLCSSVLSHKQTTFGRVHSSTRHYVGYKEPKMSKSEEFPPDSIEARFSRATTQFGLNFIKELDDNKDNVVISPLSLQTALNMLLLGAKDSSATQAALSKVLGYDSTKLLTNSESSRLDPHKAARSVAKSIEASTQLTDDDKERLKYDSKDGKIPTDPQVVFRLANMILSNKDLVELNSGYEADLKEYYAAKTEQFRQNTRMLLPERVNSWVQNVTNNMIDQVIGQDDVKNEKLVSILLNAAYMRGRWLHRFEPLENYEGTFYNGGTNAMKTTFMHQEARFGHADRGSNELLKKLNCSVLSLPFYPNSGEELSMLILLPGDRNGVSKLQSALDAETLLTIYKSLEKKRVAVMLPKFSFEATANGQKVLTKMGLGNIFTDQAKFSRMFSVAGNDKNSPDTKVDQVIHKAKITVDETGAEAAAATAITMVLMSSIVHDPIVFNANHPFLFIIRHAKSNMPLFMGRLNKL